ncbi:MAG TPA: heterodisulfide reductase-related iron-sulfur binding cluster [Mycobacteriales bacterium]|jgi:glycolate oxidase iron-sulfur subunit|nr:heterodisulfide reductase-related iron-sulfur binding cluster [Mycobacteriales bacterium]
MSTNAEDTGTDGTAGRPAGSGRPASIDAATVGSGPAPRALPLIPAFDADHPPQAALVADCVHCGFCLPSCPTYSLWGQEMDSPRGRIDLIKEGLEGEPLSVSAVRHLDQCLGCLACVSSCPSGVRYDRLLEDTRGQIERRVQRPRAERLLRKLIYALFPHPRRLRALRGPLLLYQRSGLRRLVARSGLLKLLPAPVQVLETLAPRLGPMPSLPEHTPAVGTRRRTVGLITGCVQGAFFPDVNAATVRVLAAEGCDVVVPAAQPCCGALSAHGGRRQEALRYARRMIECFEAAGVETVVANAAGCGSNLKEYVDQLADDPAWAQRAAAFSTVVRDVSELLDELGPVAPMHPLPVTITYQDACHLGHAQGVRAQPRRLLQRIPDLQLREIADGQMCCGSAGVYNILHPDTGRELGERKAQAVVDTGAELMVTANPGCWMQVATALGARGQRMPVAHTVQVLDASIRGVPVDELTTQGLDGPGAALPPVGSR